MLPIESVPGHPDFRALGSIDGLAVDLRYATPDNFMGVDLYSPLDCAWVHREAAALLEKAIAHLAKSRPELRLVVLDALRPQRVQERIWSVVAGTAMEPYLANPVRGSIHSFGMAVDVTLARKNGRALDMGTPFDDLTERSHPSLEARFLSTKELTRAQVENRLLLRDAMTRAGWRGISTEWWHFDGGDRERIRATYARVG